MTANLQRNGAISLRSSTIDKKNAIHLSDIQQPQRKFIFLSSYTWSLIGILGPRGNFFVKIISLLELERFDFIRQKKNEMTYILKYWG